MPLQNAALYYPPGMVIVGVLLHKAAPQLRDIYIGYNMGYCKERGTGVPSGGYCMEGYR